MKGDKGIIIRKKISISEIMIFIFVLIISIASFIGYFNSNEGKNIGMLFVGILFALISIVLFPYLTFKRPYLGLNSMGIYYRRPQGFTYGKETFIVWDKIEAFIGPEKVNRKQIQEKLNFESISKLDKFNGFTPDDYEHEAEWLENSIYIVTKKENDINPEIYEIGSLLDKKNYLKNMEIILKMWIEHIS